jgi:hypothetical protein
MSRNFEEAVDRFVEVGNVFETRCFNQVSFRVVGPAMVFAT